MLGIRDAEGFRGWRCLDFWDAGSLGGWDI